MAITETRPAAPAPEATADPSGSSGLPTTNPVASPAHRHGRPQGPGRAWIVLSLLFGIAGLVLVALFHADVSSLFLPDDTVDQVATLGQVMLVLLFAIPLFIGIATYVASLQVGARTVAFPGPRPWPSGAGSSAAC
jgi:hypothetical protein